MGWLIGIALALLLVVALAGYEIWRAIEKLTFHVIRLRKELACGLGVDSDDKGGWIQGGYLREMAEDLRERKKAERRSHYERNAEF